MSTIVGRSKDLIISGGYNIYPKEIEAAIDDLPGVAGKRRRRSAPPGFWRRCRRRGSSRGRPSPRPKTPSSPASTDLARFKQPKCVSSSRTNCPATRWVRSRKTYCATSTPARSRPEARQIRCSGQGCATRTGGAGLPLTAERANHAATARTRAAAWRLSQSNEIAIATNQHRRRVHKTPRPCQGGSRQRGPVAGAARDGEDLLIFPAPISAGKIPVWSDPLALEQGPHRLGRPNPALRVA